MHGSEVVLLLIVHENLGSIPRTPKCLASRRERGNGMKSVTGAGVLVLGGRSDSVLGSLLANVGRTNVPKKCRKTNQRILSPAWWL